MIQGCSMERNCFHSSHAASVKGLTLVKCLAYSEAFRNSKLDFRHFDFSYCFLPISEAASRLVQVSWLISDSFIAKTNS